MTPLREQEIYSISSSPRRKSYTSSFKGLLCECKCFYVRVCFPSLPPGKSTLASLILRLYEPTEGSVTIGGNDLAGIDVYRLRNRIGTVTQVRRVSTLHDRIMLLAFFPSHCAGNCWRVCECSLLSPRSPFCFPLRSATTSRTA